MPPAAELLMLPFFSADDELLASSADFPASPAIALPHREPETQQPLSFNK